VIRENLICQRNETINAFVEDCSTRIG